ncbi:MAG: hypothetical protein WAS05_00285 [Candidatus Nanopelagicales bacterium]
MSDKPRTNLVETVDTTVRLISDVGYIIGSGVVKWLVYRFWHNAPPGPLRRNWIVGSDGIEMPDSLKPEQVDSGNQTKN